MMKKLMILAAAAGLALGVSAQSVQPTTAVVDELSIPAYTISLQKDVKLVQQAMEQRLKDDKLKTKKSSGFVCAPAQVVPELGESPVNLYVKVEQQGKKKDAVAVVTVAALPSSEGVSRFLQNFAQYVTRFEAQQNLNAEQKNLEKAEKALSKATAAVASLDKTIQQKQDKIADRQKDIESYKQKIKDAEKDIEDLRADIEKAKSDKTGAQQTEAEAQKEVKRLEAEVLRYQQSAQ